MLKCNRFLVVTTGLCVTLFMFGMMGMRTAVLESMNISPHILTHVDIITTTSTTPTTTNTSVQHCGGEFTLVTAFFDIGDHKKGIGSVRLIKSYLNMSNALAYIHNRIVFYTDSQIFADHFTKLRSRLDPTLTHVKLINRDALWSFSLRNSIAKLYAQPGYPKHPPNTVVPEYSCAQHSKYACILDVILKQTSIPKGEVYAWIDFGYFRNLHNKKEYCLVPPKNFDRNKAFFNQVYNPNFNQPYKNIFYSNQVWVGGGMFLASRDTMIKLCIEYQRVSEFLLFRRNLSSTDQQTLYASFTAEGKTDLAFGVDVQVDPGPHGWFHLGMSCLREMSSSSQDFLKKKKEEKTEGNKTHSL